jgi:hypothetical protein
VQIPWLYACAKMCMRNFVFRFTVSIHQGKLSWIVRSMFIDTFACFSHVRFSCSQEKEMLTVTNKEPLRRFSLVPPGGGTPAISLTPDDGGYVDRNRRPSLQNMGHYNHVSHQNMGHYNHVSHQNIGHYNHVSVIRTWVITTT